MTITLRNTGQELSLEQPPPHSNGLLYRNGKVCVPDLPEVKKRILFECHDAPSVGHPGIHRTLVLISTQFYWPKMRPDIHSYVTKCHQCLS